MLEIYDGPKTKQAANRKKQNMVNPVSSALHVQLLLLK